MAEKKLLEDADWLFSMLTALVKKEGGEIRIFDDDLMLVGKQDIIGLYYDKKQNCTILKLVSPAEVFNNKTIIPNDELDN